MDEKKDKLLRRHRWLWKHVLPRLRFFLRLVPEFEDHVVDIVNLLRNALLPGDHIFHAAVLRAFR